MPRYKNTERLGVTATDTHVTRDLGWIFRDQPLIDMGIDAHIEEVVNGTPAGALIGVQIKTGPSHFKEKADHYVFRGDLVHLDYWLSHSLPVIIVGHLPEDNQTFWVHVTEDDVKRTSKSWTIKIPKSNLLNGDALSALSKIADGTDQERRLRALTFHKPIIKRLLSGERIILETDEWIQKTLGRGVLRVSHIDVAGTEEVLSEQPHWYVGYSLEEVIKIRFPWANVQIDEEFYDQNLDEEALKGMYSLSWLFSQPIYPFTVECGEVAYWRLELTVSDLGKAMYQTLLYLDTGEVS